MKPWNPVDFMEMALIWARIREIEPEAACDELRDLMHLAAAHGLGRKPGLARYLSQLGDA